MGRPSKHMAKNSNSKFTTRNNKQEIFSRISKTSKSKFEVKINASETKKEFSVEDENKPVK